MTAKPSYEELERRTRELQESEIYYRTLLESVNDAVLVHEIGFDGMPGKFIDTNRVALKRLGYTHAELLKLTPKDITTENGYKDLSEARANITSNCAAIFETIHLARNGRPIPVESHVSVVELAGQRVAVSVARDLSERKMAEKARRKSESFLRSTVDGLSAQIAVLDECGKIILTNKSYRDFGERNGVEPSTVSEGTNYLGVCDTALGEHSEEAKPFAEGIREVLSGKRPSFELEYPCHSPDEKRWFIGRVTPIQGEGARRVVVAHENISERKQAEEVQRESLQRLEFALQGGELGTWDWNPQDGAVVYSDLWAQMLEYRPDEVEPTVDFFKQHVHPKDLSAVLDRLTGHVEGRLPVYESEHRLCTKSGSYFWVMDRGRIVERDKQGSPVRVTGIIADITERKRAEEALRERIKEMNAFYHLSSLVEKPTMVLDELYQEMANVLPQSWQYPEVTCARIVISDREFRSSNFAESLWHQTEIIRVKGTDVGRIDVGYIEEKPEQDEGPFLKEERKLIQAIAEGIGHITNRKQAEEKIHASLQEKEILLRELHHRVKNNMQVISGLLDLQARSSGNPELIEMLNKSQSRIRSMALVHEQLYASRDLEKIDMVGYVRALSQELFQVHKIDPRKIDMIVQPNGNVYVDINKAIPCGLILNELVSNALKHAFPGNGPGELRIIIHETKNNKIEIIVRDNGLGLPDDVDIHQPRSMGLYLVNGLVKKQLEGQIEVRRDNTTEFRIKFPL